MAIDGFLLRHSDVVLNLALRLSHQTKGCAWVLMLPWHKQPLAQFKGLFMEKVCVCLDVFTHARN